MYSNNTIAQSIFKNNRKETLQNFKKEIQKRHKLFKNGIFDKKYTALPQAEIHCVEIKNYQEITTLKNDFDNQISFEVFEKKYQYVQIGKNELIIIKKDEEENKYFWYQVTTEFGEMKLQEIKNLDTKMYKKNTWIYFEENNTITAFYFLEDMTEPIIPKKYADFINYVDCMIDTTTKDIIIPKWDNSMEYSQNPIFLDFRDKIDKISKENPENTTQKQTNYVKSQINKDTILIQKVYDFCIENNTSYHLFEEFAHLTDAQLLELNRRIRIYGSCGADLSVANHNIKIALLCAKTQKWDIFLRACLDIHKANRYVTELENAKINTNFLFELEKKAGLRTFDLLFGISLKANNLAQNHYSYKYLQFCAFFPKNGKRFEKQILEILTDKNLDKYNKIIFYHIFRTHLFIVLEGKKSEKYFEKIKEKLQFTKETIWNEISFDF